MDRPRSVPTLLAVAALLVPLTGCSGEPDETPTVTVTATVNPPDEEPETGTSEPSEPSAQDEGPLPDVAPDDDAPFVANTEPDTSAPSSGALLSATNLRFGVHDGYDRLVLDVSGDGDPGWRAEYVDTPTGQASGEPFDLDGNAFLTIYVQGMIYPGEPGSVPYEGPDAITPASGGVIREVVVGGVFEGTQQIVVGLDSEEPFRVYLLEDPTRIVLDVQHP
jgi:hypothetical protein